MTPVQLSLLYFIFARRRNPTPACVKGMQRPTPRRHMVSLNQYYFLLGPKKSNDPKLVVIAHGSFGWNLAQSQKSVFIRKLVAVLKLDDIIHLTRGKDSQRAKLDDRDLLCMLDLPTDQSTSIHSRQE